MIRHICMFQLKEEADGRTKAENVQKALELSDILKVIPTVEAFEIVTNSPAAPESNYEVSLIIDFKDIDGLHEYQIHPNHVEFGDFIKAVRESRACIDYEF